MSPRTNQLERTRMAILETAEDMLMSTDDPAAFTMQAVADAAGVSARTLYRHFPSRQELFNATGARMDASRESATAGIISPTSFDGWVAGAMSTVTFGTVHRDLFKKTLALGVTTGEWRTDRDEMYWVLFQRRFPHLPAKEARASFVMIRHTLSAANVILIGERFDLAPDELAPAVQQAVDVLVASVTARDEAARGASS